MRDIKFAKVAYCKECEGCILVAALEHAENDAEATAEFDELFKAGHKLATIPADEITWCECPEVSGIAATDADEEEEEDDKINYPITKHPSFINYWPSTLMDELAVKELNEILKFHGAESILAMVKAGQEVRV